MISLTWWAASSVSEGSHCRVNALRVPEIGRHRENVLLFGRGRYLVFLQGWIKHTWTEAGTHALTRFDLLQEFPPGTPDI